MYIKVKREELGTYHGKMKNGLYVENVKGDKCLFGSKKKPLII
jgi:hypothetical protein